MKISKKMGKRIEVALYKSRVYMWPLASVLEAHFYKVVFLLSLG